ncbi:MAG: hypothetical protein EXS29_03595 [Pedosphaera sp.]|nr:hypothetical protein [Pedosphaera sp.]
MALLPGYIHTPLQGIDSIVGKISKPDGLRFFYEIGAIPVPGRPLTGGSFSNYAKSVPVADRLWLKEQQVGGQDFHLALTKRDILIVSLPASGINISVSVKTPEEMAEALLTILSFRAGK